MDWIAEYMWRVESMPVLSRVNPGDVLAMLPEHQPEDGIGASKHQGIQKRWEAVFEDLERIILPGLTHWQSPNFYGFFPCNASGPAIIGEMLSAGLNVNGMLWATSPAATELETRVLDWMAEMAGLPPEFLSTSGNGGGCIQGTASESTLIAMVAARGRALGAAETTVLRTDSAAVEGVEGEGERRAALSVARSVARDLVAYASEQAHSSVIKAAMIAGLARGPEDREHLRLIGTDESFAMRPDLLEQALREDLEAGRTPFFVCATVGTTSSTAVDAVDRIAGAITAACGGGTSQRPVPPATSSLRHSVTPSLPWLHVDAAHAGCACVCPEFRWMLRGIEHADSLCFNPHKWLLTNFDCDCFSTRDRRSLVSALSITPEYLRNAASEAGGVIDYRDWQVPLGRRFRALKLWLVIRHYGAAGLRAYIREHVRLAALLESWVREDPRFEIAAPRTVNLVCFRLRGGAAADGRNRALLEAINASGKAYLTHTMLGGRYTLRMAIGSAATEERHVRGTWEVIRAMSDER